MTQQPARPQWWQRRLQRIPASRLGSWVFAITLHYIDRPLLQLTRGQVSVPGLMTGLPMVMLTTIGAKSGEPRTLPLIGIVDAANVVLVASNWGGLHHPAWYYNLCAHPEAQLTLAGRTGTYIAREVTGAEYEDYWRKAVEVYAGYEAYQQRAGRKIPIMILAPQ